MAAKSWDFSTLRTLDEHELSFCQSMLLVYITPEQCVSPQVRKELQNADLVEAVVGTIKGLKALKVTVEGCNPRYFRIRKTEGELGSELVLWAKNKNEYYQPAA